METIVMGIFTALIVGSIIINCTRDCKKHKNLQKLLKDLQKVNEELKKRERNMQ